MNEEQTAEAIARLEQRMRELTPANWQVNEDDESLCLQIELGNDFAVTLTTWKNGDPSNCALWRGGCCQDFDGWPPESFRSWLAEARKPI